jgi:hypothetical protein
MNAAARLSPHSCFRNDVMDVGRFLIVAGLVVLVAGLLWPVMDRIGFGRLPGDLIIERQNVTLHVPLATSVVLSLAFSLLLLLLAR